MALAGSYLHDHASQLDVTDASMDEVDTVSNGSDRGRVDMEEQATRLQHGDKGANVEIPNAKQSIIVHEQSQPPWVPSPRRHEVCSYTDNEAEARVPPLAPAEEDSLDPSRIGEEVRGHMKRKVRRTIRRFFFDGQAYYRGHHIVTGTQLAAFFGQATVQRVWNPAKEALPIEQQQRRQQRRRYWQTLAGDIYEFRDGEAHLRPAPAVPASHQVTPLKRTGYMTFNAQSLVRPGRLNLTATYMIDKNIQVAGLQGPRLGGEERIVDQGFTARYQVCSVRGLPVGLRSHVTPQGSGWGYQHEYWSLARSAC